MTRVQTRRSQAGPASFETDLVREVDIVRDWVSALMARLGWRERDPTYRAMLACLHALRDCLPRDAAMHLALALPPVLRGLYLGGWRISGRPAASRTRQGFLERIHEGVHRDPGIDPEALALGVLALLAERLPPAELENARAATPSALHPFWPS